MAETRRRREKQTAYNLEYGIEPRSIIKDVASPLLAMSNLDYHDIGRPELRVSEPVPDDEVSLAKLIGELEKRMKKAAKELDFEEAARLRDRVRELRRQQIYKS
jgi:excinuclease ABC subunit B